MTGWLIVVGILVAGALSGAVLALLLAQEPSVTIRNGVLKGWVVTRDDETFLCANPTVFIVAKQIECD